MIINHKLKQQDASSPHRAGAMLDGRSAFQEKIFLKRMNTDKKG
jgi:hypothetical protein